MRSPVIFVFVLFGAMALAGPAQAGVDDPGGSFIDDDGDIFEPSIEAIFAEGITVGCSDRQQFCPDRGVTRGEMAAFLSRALGLPATATDYFDDDDTSIFNGDINKIAEAGITNGCNPPANDRFCPNNILTRGEMAAFLVRGFDLEPATITDRFTDDDDSIFEDHIDSLAEANITFGCNPPDNDQFCPRDHVSRGAMAAFLTRAIPLETITPPPRPPTHLVSRYTTYHNCCEARVTNIQTMARQLDGWIVLPWEEFDLNEVTGPRTSSKGYVPAPILLNGESYCCSIGGGTSQFATTIYNAFFWGGYDEIVHKPHSIYISRYPVGIEATLGSSDPLNVVFLNDTWNPIYINTSYTSTSITVELSANNDGRSFVGRWSGGPHHSFSGGGSDARRVSAKVTGSPPGTVRIDRTIDGPDGIHTETWFWTYSR